MPDFQVYLWIVAGVAVSFAIPVVMQSIKPSNAAAKAMLGFSRVWFVAKPYLLMAIASFLLAAVTLAIAKASNADLRAWYRPFLLGYFWDSTVQKFKP